MKILVLTHTIPRFEGDPSAPFIHTLCDSFVRTGHKVIVLTPFNAKIDKNYKRNYKLESYKYIIPDRLHVLGYSQTLKGDKSMSFLSYFLSPFLYFFGFVALLRIVKKEKPDIISSHWMLPNGFISALVSGLTKVPFTTTIPGSDVYMAGKNFLFRQMAKFTSDMASCVISDSLHYLKQLNDLGIYPKKTMIIRYGVDPAKFQIGKVKTKKQRIILAVGRMVAKKGFKFLLEALPKVLKKDPNVKLILVGDGEERKNLEHLAYKLKIRANVEFSGMVQYNRLPSYYSKADIFVMPSVKDEEGNIDASPVSMMEAMCSGLPVVATRFAGDENLITSGKTGYLVLDKDSNEIAQAIILLLKRGKNGMSKNTVRKIALANFSSRVIAGKYTYCFKDCILQ